MRAALIIGSLLDEKALWPAGLGSSRVTIGNFWVSCITQPRM